MIVMQLAAQDNQEIDHDGDEDNDSKDKDDDGPVSAIGIAILMREYAVHADYAHEDENLIHICKAL